MKQGQHERIKEIEIDLSRLGKEINSINLKESKDSKELALEKTIESLSLYRELKTLKKLPRSTLIKIKTLETLLRMRHNKKFKAMINKQLTKEINKK